MRRLLLLALIGLAVALLPGCDPPPADGFFDYRPAGTALPSEASCSDQVHQSGWEPRPQNDGENQTTPNVSGVNGYAGMEHQDQTWGRVHGNYVGTTDEEIQFAACKWGLDDNVIRAEAIVESNWDMDQLGDFGDCGSGAASFGLLQIKKCAHPGTYPNSANSTSFNLDYYGALIRGCANGWDYVTNTQNDVWGCVGRWYSGGWHDSGAQWYIGEVQRELAEKNWRGWSG